MTRFLLSREDDRGTWLSLFDVPAYEVRQPDPGRERRRVRRKLSKASRKVNRR